MKTLAKVAIAGGGVAVGFLAYKWLRARALRRKWSPERMAALRRIEANVNRKRYEAIADADIPTTMDRAREVTAYATANPPRGDGVPNRTGTSTLGGSGGGFA